MFWGTQRAVFALPGKPRAVSSKKLLKSSRRGDITFDEEGHYHQCRPMNLRALDINKADTRFLTEGFCLGLP